MPCPANWRIDAGRNAVTIAARLAIILR